MKNPCLTPAVHAPVLPAGAAVAGWVFFLPMDERVLFTAHSEFRLNAQDRQFFRAVGAQHEDALNVAGSAWTGDERDETWIVRYVFVPQQRERGGQVWEELLPTGEDNVVRGQR